ncbi:hypothetical protein ACQ4PT_063647 [Festuca glaucescens]
MEGSFLASAVEDAATLPSWVLLEKNAYCNNYGETCFDNGDNTTTAHAGTSGGHTVKVTFRLASPPAVSSFCFHDPFDPVKVKVMSSAKDLVLFRPSNQTQHNLYEYFVYQAASHGTNNGLPTLKLIPAIHHSTSSYPAILPCDDDDGEFLIADLSATRDRRGRRYILDVFSSKTNKWVQRRAQDFESVYSKFQSGPVPEWVTWPLQLEEPLVVTQGRGPDKVMALGGGAVGWINMWQGIVVCNMLDQHPVLRFIPLPKPRIDLCRVDDLRMVRDVTCCDGTIKFLEMDSRFKRVSRTKSKCNKTLYGDREGEDIIYDSELLLEDGSCPMEFSFVPDGWKIRTCYRHISWDYWRMGHVVDSDDIEIDNTRFSMALNNLTLSYPTFGACGDDVVYMCSRTYKKWMVGM